MLNPYSRKKYEEKFLEKEPWRVTQIIEGQITEEDYDHACKLFSYVHPTYEAMGFQQPDGNRCHANKDCLLGLALQRMGYGREQLDLGSRFHFINGQQFRADIETQRAIEKWYCKDEAPMEFPLHFTLLPTTMSLE